MGKQARITQEEKDKIRGMMDRGLTNRQIHWVTGRSISTLQKIREQIDAEYLSERDQERLKLQMERRECWEFLNKNWHFTGRPIKKEEPEHRYRIVHPGDIGIRTPYRPDGRFR